MKDDFLNTRKLSEPGAAWKGPRRGPRRLVLGDWLVRRRLIDRRQLFEGLDRSYRKGCRIGDALVELGALSRPVVEREVARCAEFNAFSGGDLSAR